MRIDLGTAGAEGVHIFVILDAHVSRWNTSGSEPPMLLLNLLTWHVVPAQSVAHVKVYVPTLKRPTAPPVCRPTGAYSGSQQPALRCGKADQ
jgi:hypothetical protein